VSLQLLPVTGAPPAIAPEAPRPLSPPVLPAAPVLAAAPPLHLDDLTAAQRGDQVAFARLVRGHQARIFSVALRLTGRREDAEELAQDAFVQLHGVLAQIHSPSHLLHWLLRTISHRSIDRLRARDRLPRMVQMDAQAEPAVEERGDHLAARRLRALLLELPAAPRAVMLLKYQEDLEPTEIASVLDMSVNTVKSHLRRSLEWLRSQQVGAGKAGEQHGS
jgi:RNA polymerase sigma-70 factor (ECF subfamily)